MLRQELHSSGRALTDCPHHYIFPLQMRIYVALQLGANKVNEKNTVKKEEE